MTKQDWVRILAGGTLALVVLIGGALLFLPAAEAANDAGLLGTNEIAQAIDQIAAQTTAGNVVANGRWHWGGPGSHNGGLSSDDTYLADALGITVEELQAAREEALSNALDQAVESGLITQEQADEILSNGGLGRHGGLRGLGRAIDHEAFLAEALGISVEELRAAKSAALEAAVADAVEAGTITQEQADLILARNVVKNAIDRDSLAAGALGMTVEEYQAALAGGTTLSTLMEEAGMTVAEFRTAVNEAYQAAVQQLADDGAITQEQADQILSRGLGFGRGFGNCPFGHDSQEDTITPSALDA